MKVDVCPVTPLQNEWQFFYPLPQNIFYTTRNIFEFNSRGMKMCYFSFLLCMWNKTKREKQC